jgi:predicted nucleic acid-binding protein
MNAVDTNVFMYAHDPRDPVKQQQALSLIQTLTDGALLWQVACEYVSASRKLAVPDAPADVARGFGDKSPHAPTLSRAGERVKLREAS